MRVVLDTNVWLDWLVFDDPSVAALKVAYHEERIEIAIDNACFDELATVLSYPAFALDDPQTRNHLANVERCVIRKDERPSIRTLALPRCSDPDDQKFLELARDAQADWLITKDKALLGIRRGQLKSVKFQISTPMQWASSAN